LKKSVSSVRFHKQKTKKINRTETDKKSEKNRAKPEKPSQNQAKLKKPSQNQAKPKKPRKPSQNQKNRAKLV